MNPRRIGILHMNQIGDFCFSLPLLANLRRSFPEAEIVSILPKGLEELARDSSLVDGLILRERGATAWLRVLTELRERRLDWLFCLPRSEGAMAMTALSRSRRRFGFARKPWDFGLTDMQVLEGHHGWPNYRKFLNALELPVTATSYVGLLEVRAVEVLEAPERPFAVLSPGASLRRECKTWTVSGFAGLMAELHRRWDLVPLLVGSAENAPVNRAILDALAERSPKTRRMARDFSGSLGLAALCSMLRKASLFVGIDSGVMHLASALDRPTVGIFGPTDPLWVAPQNAGSRIVRRNDLDCMPCYMKGCSDRPCLEGLEANAVLSACSELLEGALPKGKGSP